MTSSTYVLTDGKRGVVTYPFHVDSLRYMFPNVSFPEVISEATMAEFNVFPVEDVERPSIDPMRQNIDLGHPVNRNDVWTQNWIITDFSPEEQASRLASHRNDLSCSSAQGMIELNNMGFLDDAEEIVAESDRTIQLAWAHSTIWRRTSPTIEAICKKLGFTDEDLDNLFTSAARIIV